jgi:hypothetical protein
VTDREPDDDTAPVEPEPAQTAEQAPVEGAGEPPADTPPRTGGIRSWGKGYEGPLAIAALVIAVIALVVGGAGLYEARHKTTKSTPKTTTTTKPTSTTKAPSSGSGAARQVTVPDVTNTEGTKAAVQLKNHKLSSDTNPQSSPTVAKGNVISQDPAAGAKVAEGTVVHLTISTGP